MLYYLIKVILGNFTKNFIIKIEKLSKQMFLCLLSLRVKCNFNLKFIQLWQVYLLELCEMFLIPTPMSFSNKNIIFHFLRNHNIFFDTFHFYISSQNSFSLYFYFFNFIRFTAQWVHISFPFAVNFLLLLLSSCAVYFFISCGAFSCIFCDDKGGEYGFYNEEF